MDTQQQWEMKVTLGPLQSHVMSCNLILGELLLGCPGFWHPKVICWDVFYPTQDAKKLVTTRTRMTSFFFFFEDSRKPELKPSFATIASWESQVIIAIQPPQGLTVTIIYLHPQPLPSRKVQQLLTTSQHRVILAWEVCCLTVGKRFWSTNKKLGALTWMIIEVAAGSLKYWKITRWWFQIYIYIIVYL